MKTLNVNQIVEAAREIVKERNMNILFFANGNIIEGCKDRKTSEEYEFNAETQEAIYDNTRNEIATAIILEAIESLKSDDKVEIEVEESEEIEETKTVETSNMNISPLNNYYLRFTEDAEEDLNRGTSLFKTGSMSEAIVIEGLCGFKVDLVGLSKSQIEKMIANYAANFSYYSEGRKAVIFEGETIGNNRNSEGVIFKPYRIEGYVKF